MKNLYTKISVAICILAFVNSTLAQNYKLPKYTSFKLSNGLTVNLMEQHDVPVISISAIVPAGAIYDANKKGLASLTATALKHGTQNFSKANIDEEIDFLGAYISTYASKEYAGLSSKFAAKDSEKVLTIFKEILLNPTFNSEEFEKEKSKLLVELEQRKESPRAVIGSYFDKLIYGNHVYGNVISGTVNSVEKLKVTDVQDFYKNNYFPNESAISIVGDFDTNKMKTLITKLFSSWTKQPSVRENIITNMVEKPLKSKVLLVNKEDANETTFYIGSTGISRNNPDYVAISVVNTLFGGRFTSMLNDELRVNSGLTYGASSRFSALKNAGTFNISTFTAKETTQEAIDKALDVLNALHQKGIDEKALTSAKNYVKGQFPPDYETTDQLAGLLTEMFWYNFDASFINNFENNVNSLNLSKANEIISKYFPKENLQFVLVGKASEIKPIAEKYGEVTIVEIKD